MAEEFVTKSEFREYTMEFKAEMASLKTEMVKNTAVMVELKHSIDLMKVISQTEYDERYRLKRDMLADANAILDDAQFADKCEQRIKVCIDKYFDDKRENVTKWGKFIDALIKIAILALAAFNLLVLANGGIIIK